MGGIAPNPATISVLKFAGYSAFGWLVRRRAWRPGNSLGFALVRLLAGWLVGLTFFFVIVGPLDGRDWSDQQVYLLFLVPRLGLWAALLHLWFRPRGGTPALLFWSLLGLALSTAIDLLVFRFAASVRWFGIGIC
jgi:hypothetical protein